MPNIIKDNAIIDSPLVLVQLTEATIDCSNSLLPLAFYLAHQAAFAGRTDIGVWLQADEAVEDLAPFVATLAVIALDLPQFGDGRAYSSAALLRQRYGFKGEIRAVGDVRRDQLEQMLRCGINAYALAPGQDEQACLQGLLGFTFNYQASVDRPQPLFRQRA
jgi:uncharacterized protein (DUF934 family)